MSSLGDSEWQSKYVQRFGSHYTSPREALEAFDRVEHAALISGRPDIAAALSTRVTPYLCEKYATVLMALRELRSPGWLDAELPKFGGGPDSPTSMELELQQIETDQWDTSNPEMSLPYPESDESSLAESIVEPVSSGKQSRAQFARVVSAEPQIDNFDPLEIPASDANVPVGNAELLREAKLAMLGWSTLPLKRSSALSEACFKSVMADILSIASTMEQCRSRKDLGSKAAIRDAERAINAEHPRTPLECLVAYRSISLRAFRVDNTFHKLSSWLIGINLWVNGNVSPMVVLEKTSVPLSQSWKHRFQIVDHLPSDLHHNNLLAAGLNAWFARHFGLELPEGPEIVFESRWQYHQAIARRLVLNRQCLMTRSTRDQLSSTWDQLAGVFLAQDPAILDALYNKRISGYPAIPASIDQVFMNVFSIDELHSLWDRVVDGFGHDIRIWLDLQEISRHVAQALRTKKDLSRLDICNE